MRRNGTSKDPSLQIQAKWASTYRIFKSLVLCEIQEENVVIAAEQAVMKKEQSENSEEFLEWKNINHQSSTQWRQDNRETISGNKTEN